MLGSTISLILLYSIWSQVSKQFASVGKDLWKHTGPIALLWISVLLMLVNTLLEGTKWFLLTGYVSSVSYGRAFSSYLAGIAFSIVTPNRMGEYPGRILYLGQGSTSRYITVSILGLSAQLISIYAFGLIGLLYYNFAVPSVIARLGLLLCLALIILVGIIYLRFESWFPNLERVRWLRQFVIYGRLLKKITKSRKALILAISLFRFIVFTAQYLFLLKWMNVELPVIQGFCTAALFFWALAVIPSIALTELGVRGAASLYLFQQFSSNSVGILAATVGIWLLNLILPSILGSLLVMKMRLLR